MGVKRASVPQMYDLPPPRKTGTSAQGQRLCDLHTISPEAPAPHLPHVSLQAQGLVVDNLGCCGGETRCISDSLGNSSNPVPKPLTAK